MKNYIILFTLYVCVFPFLLNGQSNNRYTIAYDYVCNKTNNDSIYVPMMLLDNLYYVGYMQEFRDSLINDSSIIELIDNSRDIIYSDIEEYHCFFANFVKEKIDYNFNSALFFTNISNNILIAKYFPTIMLHSNKRKYYEECRLSDLLFAFHVYLFHFGNDNKIMNVYKIEFCQ